MGKSKKRDRDSSSSDDSDSSTSSSKHHSHKSKKKHKKDAREKTSKGKKDKKEKHAKKHKKSHSEERDKATVSHLAQWMAEGMEAEFGGTATTKPAPSAQQPPIPPTISDHKHHLPSSRSNQPPTAPNTRTPMVPQRPEEFEREQQQVRRIIDPIDGRSRLVKGTGEIIEEIVSRERHHEINKQATKGDGAVYSKVLHSLANDG